ncbi:MAG: glycoside hydrolase family 92 protein [Candidatus Symbiothrix sp.]|jgi:predicted alpha-1,2-mannosidase|nr:glycoside hydrolase family 92 protein [Candidatus Symbiothrix sp.]
MKSIKLKWNCLVLFVIATNLVACRQENPKTPVDYVNPYMGNISHLLVPTYPTIHLPNSLLRVVPLRNDYTGNKLCGLPVLLASHRSYRAFTINPYQGTTSNLNGSISYEYDNEIVKPYFYSVYLNNIETHIRYAPSHQSAIYELDFEGTETPYLLVNTENGCLTAKENTISGWQWVGNTQTKAYLYLETQQQPLLVTGVPSENEQGNVRVMMRFKDEDRKINVRYGVSFISEEQARKNLQREIQDYDLQSVSDKGRNIWNEALGKIAVQGDSEEDKTIFYTSLYRVLERMICISEDGAYYSGFDGKVHNDEGVPFYTDDWLWDTYRAAHPLRVIIDPEKETQMLTSFIRMAEQAGQYWMPTFPDVTGDTRRMNSNHGVATILDCYEKGLRNFDLEKAYQACKGAITEKTLAPWSCKKAGRLDDFYKENGYFPALSAGENEAVPEVDSWEKRQPVAVTLGTVYDEWCLSGLAKQLGKKEEYNYFLKRSCNYDKLFHPSTKFFHPKDEKGNFIESFDYSFSGGLGARDAYDENNGWVYRWDVQHNIAGLIDLMGGRENFVAELEKMFDASLGKEKYEFYSQLPDHTGNVGQFSMANEPSLHIPYLYNYAGEPWRTQKRIRTLLNQWFRNDLMGIPGDEDGGGMSAFVVFSQLGFYPVTPGLPMYVIGSPVFERASLQLANGKTFEIHCKNYSPENKYIQSAKLNGKDWNRSWFSHADLMQGGQLELVMGKYPNKQWASGNEAVPPSFEMN